MGRVRPALPALRRQEVHETGGDSVVKEDRSLTVNIYYAPPIFEVKYVDPFWTIRRIPTAWRMARPR